MTFKLYNAPQSTCSQRVRFVLNAKNLPFAEVKLDLLAGDPLDIDLQPVAGEVLAHIRACDLVLLAGLIRNDGNLDASGFRQ